MDDASDLSRRIDDLLSGAIDEQVREQRALAELMLGVRDGIAQLSEQIASLGDSVEAAREASERVQLAPASGPAEPIAERFESIETAIGELSGTVAALTDRPDPVTLDPEEARALFGATAEAAREAASSEAASLRDLIDAQGAALRQSLLGESGSTRESLLAEVLAARESVLAEASALKDASEGRHAELVRRFEETKQRSDDIETRMRALEMVLEKIAEAPAEISEALGQMSSSLREQTESLVERVSASNATTAGRLADAADRMSDNSATVSSGLDVIAGRFETLQESLLAYLQVRDVALEEERDRVIAELLEEFAREMDTKQRRFFGRGVRGAWASLSDKRAARRFRTGEGRNVPRMPEAPPEALRAAAATLATAPERGRKASQAQAGGRPAARPVEVSRPAVVMPPEPRPEQPEPKPERPEPRAERPKQKPPGRKAAAKKPAKPAKAGTRPAKGSQKAAAEAPADADILALQPEAPGEEEMILDLADLLAPPPESPSPVPGTGPGPEPTHEARAAESLVDAGAPPAAEPEQPLSVGEISVGAAPAGASEAPAPAETPVPPPKPPRGRSKAPGAGRAKKGSPETPEDKKAAKLARAARRRAHRAAGNAAGAPGAPPPESGSEGEEESSPQG